MKINTSYFPSVIILLGVFIFLSLFFGTGNVIPYSKVSNFSSFEGFDMDDKTGGGFVDDVKDTIGNVTNTVSGYFAGSNGQVDSNSAPVDPNSAPVGQVGQTAPPVNPGGIEPFATLSRSGNNYSSYN